MAPSTSNSPDAAEIQDGSNDALDAGDARLTVLEPALWRRLAEASGPDDLALAWLTLQCRMIAGTKTAIVQTRTNGAFRLLAAWPEAGIEPDDLKSVAGLALAEKRPVARGPDDDENTPPAVAVPILIGDNVEAVIALSLETLPAAQVKDALRTAIRQLQWGSAWLREQLRLQRSGVETRQLDRSRTTIDLIASVLEHERFATAALAAVTDLAVRFNCTRVSIGFVRRGVARVAAISHTAQFGREMALVRKIGTAMDEAVDQRAVVLYPPAGNEPVATIAHAELARQQADGHVLTIPVFVVDRYLGAITFERPEDLPFSAETVQLLDVVVTAIGPVLEEKRRNDRWLIVKAGESFATQFRRLFGPGYIGRKLIVAALVAIVAFLSLATDEYRVSADAEIQGSVRRAVVSAYDGYIRDAGARAGETVKAGQVLATLDDQDLALERLRWVTEKQQHQFEYDQALATRQPATINVTKSKIDQADAQIRLLDEEIARTKLVAPFDGLVVSGDLSQRIGAAVTRGELLFEIAPLNGYRVIMRVDERQIADVKLGQAGQAVFTALPDEPLPIVIEKITPVAQSRDGQNLFQVEGTIAKPSTRLRPGMIGVAKIDIERRSLFDIWTRPLMDWLRLALWRWIA